MALKASEMTCPTFLPRFSHMGGGRERERVSPFAQLGGREREPCNLAFGGALGLNFGSFEAWVNPHCIWAKVPYLMLASCACYAWSLLDLIGPMAYAQMKLTLPMCSVHAYAYCIPTFHFHACKRHTYHS